MNTPAAAPAICGPAFPLGVRLLATALIVGLVHWALRSQPELASVSWNGWTAAVMTGALALAAWTWVWMWRSRTGVDAQGIHQTWIRDKHVAWSEISQARLIAIPFLDKFVTPRLVVRPRGGGIVIFHSADPRVLQVFASYVTCGVPPFPAEA